MKHKDKFIVGIDVSPEVNLTDGYVSVWENPNKDDDSKLFLISQFVDDDFRYSYEYINHDELLSNIDNAIDLKGFLSFMDMTYENFLNDVDMAKTSQQVLCRLVYDLHQYFGFFFNNPNTAKTIDEILKQFYE